MKITERPKKKRLIVAMVSFIGILAVAGGSFAAYSSQAYQRGVVRNRDAETIRFTSNYLQGCAYGEDNTSAYAKRMVYYSEDQKQAEQLTMDIYVYNYADGNVNLVSQRDIGYKITFDFSGGSDSGYSVTHDEKTLTGSGTSYKADNMTLTGRSANFHKYTVTFPGNDLNSLRITVKAVPTNPSVTNNQQLAAVIAPCTGVTLQTFTARGEFIYNKTGTTIPTPDKYDGFNYEVSISSGKAEVTLSWDKSLLEIDSYFLKKIKPGITDDEIKTILTTDGKVTFEMDQTKGTGNYLIPFYIKDKGNIPTAWEGERGMESKIHFEATQKTDESTEQ